MVNHGVLIVGAGPTGLALAVELARRGVPFRIIDREQARPNTSRAIGTQRRTTEVFQMMGISRERLAPSTRPRGLRLSDGSRTLARIEFDPGDAGLLIMDETDTERVLEERLAQLGGTVAYGRELVGFRELGDGVVATVRGPDGDAELAARFLVGADGAHSAVRELAGIGFNGITYPEQFLLADLDLDWEPSHDEARIWVGTDGLVAALPLPGERRWRIIAAKSPEAHPERRTDAELTALAEQLLRERSGLPFRRLGDPVWVSAFHVHRRIADRYLQRSVLLAGDAAHVHSPIGAQGMNTGIQDAFNLGWKLALAMQGQAAPGLLESYAIERHAVAASVLRGTDYGTRLMLGRHPLARTVREHIVPLLSDLAPVRRRLLDAVAELSIAYRASPLSVATNEGQGTRQLLTRDRGIRAGDRVPNVTLQRADAGEPVALLDLFVAGWTLLLFPGKSPGADISTTLETLAQIVQAMVSDAVHPYLVLEATPPAATTVPSLVDITGEMSRVFGAERGLAALVRPDGYLGFRGSPSQSRELALYLARIFAMRIVPPNRTG